MCQACIIFFENFYLKKRLSPPFEMIMILLHNDRRRILIYKNYLKNSAKMFKKPFLRISKKLSWRLYVNSKNDPLLMIVCWEIHKECFLLVGVVSRREILPKSLTIFSLLKSWRNLQRMEIKFRKHFQKHERSGRTVLETRSLLTNQYPYLAKLAKPILVLPCSTVPVECLFL